MIASRRLTWRDPVRNRLIIRSHKSEPVLVTFTPHLTTRVVKLARFKNVGTLVEDTGNTVTVRTSTGKVTMYYDTSQTYSDETGNYRVVSFSRGVNKTPILIAI